MRQRRGWKVRPLVGRVIHPRTRTPPKKPWRPCACKQSCSEKTLYMKPHFLCLTLLSLALAACQSHDAPDTEASGSLLVLPVRLTDFQWNLTELNGQPLNLEGGGEAPYLIFFPETGRIAGSGGCNRIMGAYNLEGNQLKIGPIASTMMACPNLDQETVFLRTLEAHGKWHFFKHTLHLADNQGTTVARFQSAPLPPGASR